MNLPANTNASSRSRYDRYALLLLVITSLLRLTQLTRFELAPDEAYYWDWSRQLAWGYYDQGPMVGYVIRLTTLVFGTNAFGVRMGIWAASLGTIVCCWLLARRLFGAFAGWIAALILAATPLMAVGSLIATYDPLLVCFWALALLFLERAVFGDTSKQQQAVWMGAGVVVGLGFLSKHTMLLIAPCTLLFLVCSPPHRRWLWRPEPYAAFVIALLLYAGAFWWNAHHHWWTFGHLLFLAHKTKNTPISRLGEFIGSQALLLGPGLFLASMAAAMPTLRQFRQRFTASKTQQAAQTDRNNAAAQASFDAAQPSSEQTLLQQPSSASMDALASKYLFLFCFGYPVFAFFCLVALRAKVQANWAPCAWLTPAILWAGIMAERQEKGKRKKEKGAGELEDVSNTEQEITERKRASALPFSFLLSPFSSRVAAVAGTSALLTLLLIWPALRQGVGIRFRPGDDITTQLTGWSGLAAHVQQVRGEMERGGRRVFVAGNGYQYCALMAFYLPDHPPTYDLFLHWRLTMYAAHIAQLKPHLGEDAVFLNDGEADDQDLRAVFERVEWDPPYPVWQRPTYAAPVRYIHIARCYGYRRYTGLDWAVGG